MRKTTIRRGLKFSLLTNILFFVAVYLDYQNNASRWMWPLLVLYGAFLITVLLLFMAKPHVPPSAPEDAQPTDEDARIAIAQRP